MAGSLPSMNSYGRIGMPADKVCITEVELKDILNMLTDEQKLFLLCVRFRKGIGEIYDLYNKLAPRVGLQLRWGLQLYGMLRLLETYGLIKVSRKSDSFYVARMADNYDHETAERILRAYFKLEGPLPEIDEDDLGSDRGSATNSVGE